MRVRRRVDASEGQRWARQLLPYFSGAHLVHAWRQQLDYGPVLPGVLQRLARRPVVKGALDLHVVAAVAPCRRQPGMQPLANALRLRVPGACVAYAARLYNIAPAAGRQLVASQRGRTAPALCCRPLQTMTTGTSFGCAGQPAAPANSAPRLPGGASSRASGSMAT